MHGEIRTKQLSCHLVLVFTYDGQRPPSWLLLAFCNFVRMQCVAVTLKYMDMYDRYIYIHI